MANQSSLKIDIDPMLRKLLKTNRAIRQGAEMGMGRAMLQLHSDIILQAPTAPIKEGTLRGSVSIFIEGKKVDVANSEGYDTSKQLNSFSMALKRTEIQGLIGINVPYAAKLHESTGLTFSEPSAGPKYVESKMSSNKFVYKKIISNAIQEKASEV